MQKLIDFILQTFKTLSYTASPSIYCQQSLFRQRWITKFSSVGVAYQSLERGASKG